MICRNDDSLDDSHLDKVKTYRSGRRVQLCSLPLFLAFTARLDGGPAGEDGRGEAAAGGEFTSDEAPFGAHSGDEVAEDFVDGVFVEDAEITIGEEIHFQGLELDAGFSRHVLDSDSAEVGEAGLGAD